MHFRAGIFVLGALAFASSALANTLKPPVAEKRAFVVTSPHGGKRDDEYYWLRDDTRKDPAMLDYLKAENAYTDAMVAANGPLRDTIYKEITGRLAPDDVSVPYRKNGYWYYSRFEAGKNYPISARRKGEMTTSEEIIFDQNAWPKGRASSA